MKWITADHHFDHAAIIRYCNRPFSSVDEMNSEMIDRWNLLVRPQDTVYHLGDFTLDKDADKFLSQLNGKIYLVPGGHDKRWIKKSLIAILPPIHIIEVLDTPVILCHYAMRVWDRAHYGTCHLYAHSHGRLSAVGRSIDVGVDNHNFFPLDLEETVQKLLKIKKHNNDDVEDLYGTTKNF